MRQTGGLGASGSDLDEVELAGSCARLPSASSVRMIPICWPVVSDDADFRNADALVGARGVPLGRAPVELRGTGTSKCCGAKRQEGRCADKGRYSLGNGRQSITRGKQPLGGSGAA